MSTRCDRSRRLKVGTTTLIVVLRRAGAVMSGLLNRIKTEPPSNTMHHRHAQLAFGCSEATTAPALGIRKRHRWQRGESRPIKILAKSPARQVALTGTARERSARAECTDAA